LRNDGELLSKRLESDDGDVVAIDDDLPGGQLDDSEECLKKGRLSSTSP